jgi:uncharacterized 2Fe-2S/4Fe-4S cluster protein (DUF4445 family)
MAKIILEPEGKRIPAHRGQTLLQVLRDSGVILESLCGGFGACGKDKVLIVRGQESLNPLTRSEEKFLTLDEARKGYRLACQARIIEDGDIVVFVPPESRAKPTQRKIVSEGYMRNVTLDPFVKKIKVVLRAPSLEDPRSDYERLVDTLRKVLETDDVKASLDVLRDLPDKARNSNWSLSLVLWGNEIVSIEETTSQRPVYGLAVDIGTSKIVVHLVNLENGKIERVAFAENPQLSYGEDIMSRMSYANIGPENLQRLHRLLIDAINSLIEKVVSEAGVSSEDIYEAVIVGNTAMHHFFLGLPTRYLSSSPFTPVITRSYSLEAREAGLKINRRGKVTVLPVIAGYVGADAVADALAIGLIEKSENILLVDIGTNTEIFAGNAEDYVACSTPSGPALEGGHITFGMKAVEGAIERVTIDESGDVEYKTINNAPPSGICGSGIIDAVAQLFLRGIIDRRGKFVEGSATERLIRDEKGRGYVIAWSNETSIGKNIVLWEKDISEFLLAKAAIYAGISIALKRRKLDPENLSEVLIAGSFGYHIDPFHAKVVGMIPDVELEKIKFVGNTAIAGADLALLSRKAREEAEIIAKRARYFELSLDPLFNKEFAYALQLPHRELERFPSIAEIVARKDL